VVARVGHQLLLY